MQIVSLALRGVQFVLILLTTALVGNVIHEATKGNPASINFAMFVIVIDWLAILVGLVAVFKDAIPVIVALAFDGVAFLFTFIIATVLSAKLGIHNCNNKEYVSKNPLTNGEPDMSGRCHELQASTAFFWFLFTLLAATLASTAISSRGSIAGSSIRRGGPSMSQV